MIDLIKDGASVSACNSFGRTPPHYAVEFGGGREVVEPLLEDSNMEAFDLMMRTPLHLAAANDIAVMGLLLERNANIEAQDKDGRTLLHIAVVKHKLPQTAEFLLDNGASVNAQHTMKYDNLFLMSQEI